MPRPHDSMATANKHKLHLQPHAHTHMHTHTHMYPRLLLQLWSTEAPLGGSAGQEGDGGGEEGWGLVGNEGGGGGRAGRSGAEKGEWQKKELQNACSGAGLSIQLQRTMKVY